MADKIIIRPINRQKVVIKPNTGGGGISGVIFEVIDDHILNLKGKISVNEDGIITL